MTHRDARGRFVAAPKVVTWAPFVEGSARSPARTITNHYVSAAKPPIRRPFWRRLIDRLAPTQPEGTK